MSKMKVKDKLRVSEIQRFCMHDGPGLRTTVFLKGCPLRCAWCHNPEAQRAGAELLFYETKCIRCGACSALCKTGAHEVAEKHRIHRQRCLACGACADACPCGALSLCGKEMTTDEILAVAERDRAFYGETGGVTLSGGEPFAQGEKTVALLRACKEAVFSTAVETSGYADPETLRRAVPYVDLFLWDVKDTNGDRHQRYTGVSNQPILANLRMVSEMGARIRLRCILVNGVNTDPCHYGTVADLAGEIKNLEGIEILPYHAYGGGKTVFLGEADNGRADWIPTSCQMDEFRRVLTDRGLCVAEARK